MKDNIVTAMGIANILMLIDITNGWHSLMMFLFIGEIPGTKITISAEHMLALFVSIACALFLLAIRKSVLKLSKKIHKPAKKLKLKRA